MGRGAVSEPTSTEPSSSAPTSSTPPSSAPTLRPFDVRDRVFDDEEIVVGEAVALDLRPTGFVLRAAGAVIDVVALVLLAVLVLLLIAPSLENAVDPAAAQAIGLTLVIVLTVFLPTAVETATRGRSLGRWAVGARIVRDDGGAIGVRHAFIRALTGLLELVLTLGGIAALVGLLNPRAKRLGDLLAGTYSRSERIRPVVRAVPTVPPELTAWAAIADVARMPDQLSRRIAQFLQQASGLLPAPRARLAADLLREASSFVHPLPDGHPEAVLVALTALRREREAAALERERLTLAALDAFGERQPYGFPRRS